MTASQGVSLTAEQTPGAGERLRTLFAELFPGADGAARSDDSVREALRECDGPSSVRAMIATVDLSSRQRGLLTVACDILEEFLDQPVFHPELSRALLADCAGPLACALSTRGWLHSRGHSVLGLFRLLAELAVGWHPDHVQAEELRQRMVDWFRALREGQSPAEVTREARQWCRQFRERRALLEQRLRDRERGSLRLHYAHREAARVINRQVAGRRLPSFMVRDLQQVWLPGLQWILLNGAPVDPLWNRAVRALTLCFWSLQPPDGEQRSRRKRRRVTEEVRRELPAVLDVIMPEQRIRDRVLEELQIAWLSMDHGHSLDFREVPPLETGSLLDDAGATVSRDLLDEIAGVSTHDWFEEPASGRRFRFLMKQDDYQEMLFVDQAGLKTAGMSYEDFAWQLTSGSVVPVTAPDDPVELVSERLNMMAHRFRERRRPYSGPRVITPVSAPGAREQSVDRQAREEARQRRDDAMAAMAELADDPRRRKWARLLVSGLTLGTWLVLEEPGRRMYRKLILILSSTDKYVLVGADGTGRCELLRAELVARVTDGSIYVAESDDRYRETLDRVAEGMERKRTGS